MFRIRKVKINNEVYYQVKGLKSLHATKFAAKRQLEGLRDANNNRQ